MRHLRNDVALLQLDGQITASSKVNTVCLPREGSRVPAGTICYITGIVLFWLLGQCKPVTLTHISAIPDPEILLNWFI